MASTEKMEKSTALAVTPRFVINPWPGQVPNRERIAELKLAHEAFKPPPKFSVARLLQHDGSYLTPANVVDGIGLSPAQQKEWVEHLGKAVRGTNELTYRQDILSKMLYDRMDGATRQALFQRSMQFYRDLRKSVIEVSTPDELRKSEDTTSPRWLTKAVMRRVGRAKNGLPLSALQDLVKSHGVASIAAVLDDACGHRGGLTFRDGVLISKQRGVDNA